MATQKKRAGKTIAVDALGMEDLELFWGTDAANLTTPKSRTHVRIPTTEADDNFDYDTSDSITDGQSSEEEDTADEMELLLESQQLTKPEARMSLDSSSILSNGSLPLEDTLISESSSSDVTSKVRAGPRDSYDSIGPELIDAAPSASEGNIKNDHLNISDFGHFDEGSLGTPEVFVGEDISPVANVHSPQAGLRMTGSIRGEKRRVSFGDEPAVQKLKFKPLVTRTPSSSNSMLATPTSARSSMGTPSTDEFPIGRKMVDETYVDSADSEDEEEEDEEGITDQSGFTDTSYLQAIRGKGVQSSSKLRPGHYVEEDEDIGPVRRSTRATKGVKFDFWKGERVIYEEGGKLAGILKADPTPKKKTTSRNQRNGRSNRPQSNSDSGSEDDVTKDQNLSHSVKLPPNVKFMSIDDALDRGLLVWRHDDDSVVPAKVVCSKKRMLPPTKLPITDRRGKKTKPALAASYFYTPSVSGLIPSWIAGYIELPPGAVKDAEAVGDCSQVFFISNCQDNSVEVGVADPSSDIWQDDKAQRLLLSRGDSFYVPPGNIYRLENHSSSVPCTIFWNIIKPVEDRSNPCDLQMEPTNIAHKRATKV